MKNIIIVTTARSGSSWLLTNFVQTLNYNGFALLLSSHLNNKDTTITERISILKHNQPYVTKIFVDDMIDLELLQDDNTEFIWLYRKNIVEHFLSRTLSVELQ